MLTRGARAAFGEIAWMAIEQAILNGLRLSPTPIPTVDLGEHCHVSRLCTEEQLLDTLRRLEERHLIRRTTVEVRDPAQPLLGPAIFEAYEATGREVRHGSR